MIKGVRWHFVILCLAASTWIASSLNIKYRQKRQMQNAIFLQPLRNGRYLPPIPIQIPPYFKEGSESSSRSSASSESRGQSPWIPIQSTTSEEMNNKNIYVPPIRPPAMIVTRKPPKNTFDIPLTKSIQVSQVRPNAQNSGYIRKNVVKVHVTRTSTENPRMKMLGTLAESTVQTLLNFTPVDEGWRPKSVATPQPTAMPSFNFGKNLGSKVDKHLNYTGVRFGKVNSVLKTMPQNGAAVKVKKNETNFVMKFTPRDIKFTSVEVKTEKIDTPFFVDSPEIKHVTGDFDEHRSFFDGFSDPQKTAADLRNEGNVPYQGHKASMGKVPIVINNAPNIALENNFKDQRNIFDMFPNAKMPNKDLKIQVQFLGQGSLVNIPFNPEKINSPSKIRNNGPDQKDRTFVNKAYDSQKIKNLDANIQVPNDHRNFFIEPSNAYGVGGDQQVKSNLPYQGHATTTNKPPLTINSGFRDKNKAVLPIRESQIFLDLPSSKPVITRGEKETIKLPNDPKITYNLPYNSSPQYTPTSYATKAPFPNNKDSIPATPSYSGDAHMYDSLSNSFATSRTTEKDAITFAKVPLTTEIQHEKIDPPNPPKLEDATKNGSGNSDIEVKSIQDLNVPKYKPKSHSVVAFSHEDVSNIYENRNNGFITEDQLSSKPAFGGLPELKEVELKNPPKYLQFGDEDFLKPVIPLNFEKERGRDKSVTDLTFASVSKSDDITQQNPVASKERETLKISKIPNPFPSQISASKVEYYENSKSEDKKPSRETADSVYFQPIFPNISSKRPQDVSQQRFQNYNNEQTSVQSSDGSKEDTSKTGFMNTAKDNSKSLPYETSRGKYGGTLQKINKDVIITKNSNFSPEDAKRNSVQRGQSNDFPRIITPPPVITVNYDSVESDNDQNNKGGPNRLNRTENYVIQKKPALLPESSGRPRKPKITISTGMLAGILIAALVFLGFLTGSMVYAFHQWKFGRSRSERQKKKARSPGFPPEYLDENFAAAKLRRAKSFRP